MARYEKSMLSLGILFVASAIIDAPIWKPWWTLEMLLGMVFLFLFTMYEPARPTLKDASHE